MKRKYLIIGGDKRQEILKRILSENSQEVFHITDSADLYALGNIESYSHVILPVPLSKDKERVYCVNSGLNLRLEDLYNKLLPDQTIYSFCELPDKKLNYINLIKIPEFKLANAVLTAQGTLKLLLDNSDDYIFGKRALIIGFGDVARSVAELLCKTGLEVQITARNPKQIIVASLMGFNAVRLKPCENNLADYDYIFGTVPFNVLSENDVKSIKEKAVYFELASAPFSADRELFKKHKKHYVFGGALPGRFLPEASAKLIYDFIIISQ